MSCPVCDAEVKTHAYECAVAPYKGKVLKGYRCTGCDFVQMPENIGGFSKVVSNATLEGSLRNFRNANDERPGREFYMAEMGMDIVGVEAPSVTFFGSGLNTDHRWVKSKYPKATTKLVDLENMQGLDSFETIAEATPSDVIVASEVIEHVADRALFAASLVALVRPGGVLVLTTLNRTAASLLLGKVAAEYLLGWVPRGTHDWRKFMRPGELEALFLGHGVRMEAFTGFVYDPLTDSFRESVNDRINYAVAGIRD